MEELCQCCHKHPIHVYKELNNFTRDMCLACSDFRCDITFNCPVRGK